MSKAAIVVFTAKSVERILQEGGTSAWRLDRNHARQCAYAVCTRNAHADWTEGPEPHHTAFLIGKVKDVVPAPHREGRFLVQFSEYARLNVPDAWHGGRNPVSYGTVVELGVDPSTLKWAPMPQITKPVQTRSSPRKSVAEAMAEAKEALAQSLCLDSNAIEITIRG